MGIGRMGFSHRVWSRGGSTFEEKRTKQIKKLTHMLKFKVEAESCIFFKGGQLKNTLFISTNT